MSFKSIKVTKIWNLVHVLNTVKPKALFQLVKYI